MHLQTLSERVEEFSELLKDRRFSVCKCAPVIALWWKCNISISLHHVLVFNRDSCTGPLNAVYVLLIAVRLCGCALCKHLVTAAVERLTTEQ